MDWQRSRITVRSPKTEHHPDGESRQIPIFPELRPYLEAAWELADAPCEYLISSRRDPSVNLRTQFQRIIDKAGEKPWPKLFQNLRASRETELAERYPIHVVCAWIGNSERIAAKHYLQVRDSDFECVYKMQHRRSRKRSSRRPHRVATSARKRPAHEKSPEKPDWKRVGPRWRPYLRNGARGTSVPPRGVEPLSSD